MRKFTNEQLAAIHSLDKNTVVSAGAGSGKTSVLVERYLYLLQHGAGRDGVNAQDILAITFTRKAATEMRQRIRSRIYEKLQSPAEDHTYWQAQLLNLDKAQIGTIHGLCNSILKNNPVESNLDPAFTVAEERDAQIFLQQECREFVRRELRQQNQDVLLLTSEYGSKKFLEQLEELWQGGEVPAADEDLQKPYEEALADVKAGRTWLKERCTPDMEEVLAPGNQKLVAGAWEEIQQALSGEMPYQDEAEILNRTLGAFTLRSKKDKELVVQIKAVLKLLASVPVLEKARQLLPSWQRCLAALHTYLDERKTELGILSFDDLEYRALELLSTDSKVLAKCRQKYQYIMVDEFQDTNERQRQLIYLLAGGVKDELKGQHLFVVGDAKQSIYRFRGADVQVFAKVREEIKRSGGRDIVLAKNFRSRKKILDFCNQVFTVLLSASRQHDMPFEALEPDDQEGMIKPIFWVLEYSKEQRELERQSEGRLIAGEILRLHQEENLPFSKISILLRAMTAVEIYAAALQEAGIPYAIVDGRGFFERQEILDLINLFAVLVNPQNNAALTGILRSPYFGVDDELLTKLFLELKDAPLWDAVSQSPSPVLHRAWQILDKLQHLAACLSLPDLLNAIDAALDPVTVQLLQEGGREKAANYQKFVDLATNFAARGGTTVTWLEQIRQMRKDEVREAAATVACSDAVTIMTIHKAKGLEADTVFVPNLDARTETDKANIKYVPGRGLGISVCDDAEMLVATPVLENLKAEDSGLDEEERSRLLYVAMTRAQQRLYLLGGRLKTKNVSAATNWVKELQATLVENDSGVILHELDLEQQTVPAPAPLLGKTAAAPVIAPEKLLPLPAYGQHNSTYFSASVLQEYLYCPRRYYYEVVEQIPPLAELNTDSNGQLASTVVGHIAHQVLELYDGHNFEEVYAQAVHEFAHGDLVRAVPVRQMLEQYLASPLYHSFADKKRQAEYRMQLPLTEDGELIMTGYVDVLVLNPDGSCDIIDYKTGRPPEGNPEAGYYYQLAFYKLAVEKLLGKKVRQASLHFLRSCQEWQLPEGPWLNEALALCKLLATKKAETDYPVERTHCANCPFVYMCRH